MWARAFGPGSSVTRWGASNPASGTADASTGSTSRTATWLIGYLPGAAGVRPRTGSRFGRIESMQTGYREYSRARGGGGRSVDDGVALLAQELGRVVHRETGLAGAARRLPAAERLDAPARAGRPARAPVHVHGARLDAIEEPLDLAGILAVDAGRQAERTLVRERDRLVE